MGGGRIIIVDDERSFVDAVAIFLEDHGFNVTKAYTAREGIKACRRHRIDLAVVDVHLPDLEGTEVARALRKWHPSAPVLFISSDDSPETVAKCLAANVHMFMVKPLMPKELLDTISHLCTIGKGVSPGGAEQTRLRRTT
jgi:DNA-binding response OmpR family regulator